MSEVSWQRARQPEQREQRRRDIMNATASLFQEHGIAGVSLTGIAKEVGLSKSNLYRYFESREDIFLSLLEADYENWCELGEKLLAQLGPDADHRDVARVLAEMAVAHPRLCQLTVVLPAVLQQNISKEVYARHKRITLVLGNRMGNALHAALPKLSIREAFVFQRYMHALVSGLWPMANPQPFLAPVLEEEEFQIFKINFASEFECVVERLLRSMISE
jgi:AcrR family transcriptional regulator